MKKHLLCFYNKKFNVSNSWLIESARKFGIENIRNIRQSDFAKTAFYKQHADITSEAFGAGFYLWKPYYILETLRSLPEGDCLMYIDSGLVLESSADKLFDICREKGIVLFENYQGYTFFDKTSLPFDRYNCYTEINKCKYWCKGDSFQLMNCDTEAYRDAPLLDASMMLFRNDKQSIAFVEEWLHYCCDRRIISWDENVTAAKNNKDFVFHIYDQSIISLLAKKYDLELFRCTSQFGNHMKMPHLRSEEEYRLLPYSTEPKTNSDFGSITWHHRYKHKPLSWRWKNYFYTELVAINGSWLKNQFGWLNKKLKTPPYKTL